jgi:hypothetical protein
VLRGVVCSIVPLWCMYCVLIVLCLLCGAVTGLVHGNGVVNGTGVVRGTATVYCMVRCKQWSCCIVL